MSSPRIGFIGAGKLATALALALSSHGYSVTAVTSRSGATARRLADLIPGCKAMDSAPRVSLECDVVFITTPDQVIGQVAAGTPWRPDQGVVHCSGTATLEPLKPVANAGASIGSFHPFQTLSCVESAEEAVARLSGITYAIDGQGWVVDFLHQVAGQLGGRGVRVPAESRALYHASAVLACGYITTLLSTATDIWQALGFSHEDARLALAPLAKATVSNFSSVGAASASGPIVRGDFDTIEAQLEALQQHSPLQASLFASLGLHSLPLLSQDMDPDTRERLRQLLIRHLDCPQRTNEGQNA